MAIHTRNAAVWDGWMQTVVADHADLQVVGSVRQSVTRSMMASALLGGVVGLGIGWVLGRAGAPKGGRGG